MTSERENMPSDGIGQDGFRLRLRLQPNPTSKREVRGILIAIPGLIAFLFLAIRFDWLPAIDRLLAFVQLPCHSAFIVPVVCIALLVFLPCMLLVMFIEQFPVNTDWVYSQIEKYYGIVITSNPKDQLIPGKSVPISYLQNGHMHKGEVYLEKTGNELSVYDQNGNSMPILLSPESLTAGTLTRQEERRQLQIQGETDVKNQGSNQDHHQLQNHRR